MKKYITTAFTKIALLFIVLFTTLVQAQDDPTDLPAEPDDTGMPIDDYVWLLAIVAISFAILKFRAIYKQSVSTED